MSQQGGLHLRQHQQNLGELQGHKMSQDVTVSSRGTFATQAVFEILLVPEDAEGWFSASRTMEHKGHPVAVSTSLFCCFKRARTNLSRMTQKQMREKAVEKAW